MRDAGKYLGRRLPVCVALLMMIVLVAQTSVAFTPAINPAFTLSKYYDISGKLVNVYQNPWDVTMTADHTTVKVGSPVKLTVTVIYNGTLQKNVMVAFDAAAGSYSWSDTKFTDASGKASATINPPAAGAYRVNATARMQDGTGFKVLDSDYVIVNVQNKPIAVEAKASPESVNVNAAADIAITVKDFATQAPVSGAVVSLTKSGGRLVPASGTTGPDGTFAATFNPDAAGAFTVNVSVSAPGFDNWQGVIDVQGSDRPLSVVLETTPQQPAAGSEVTVRVIAASDGSPVSNAAVNLTSTGGQVTPVSVKTGADGVYTAKFVAGQPGSYTLTATVTADGYVSAAKSADVSVSKSADLLWLALPGAIVLGILLIILLFLLPRWLKTDLKIEPKKTKLPADGTSKLSVRVRLVNGFGRAKKTGRDTEVELEATAGAIKGVVIPAGKEYADTELTSVKAFGPVTITARSGGRVSLAHLAFIVEKGTLDITVQPAEIPADGKSSASVTIRIRDEKGNDIAPLEEKIVAVSTTLGNIPGPLAFPAKAQSVSTGITAGDVSGVAVITAVLGDFRGECRIAFKGLAKRFCMHCGTSMSLDASQCPACGRTPPSGVDVKACPTCGIVIPEPARFCYHCGASQPGINK